MGFPSATAKVFGERKKKFIIAMEDEDGRDITRPEIIKCIEGECGSPIITHEFFRKEKCALLECSIGKAYDAEFAFASSSGGGEVSGDSAIAFPSADNHFFCTGKSDVCSADSVGDVGVYIGGVYSPDVVCFENPGHGKKSSFRYFEIRGTRENLSPAPRI